MTGKTLLAASFLLSTATVQAQQEQWDTYMAKFNGKPGSIMVDLAQENRAPDKQLPWLVVTGPKAKDCTNPNGLPGDAEINRLELALQATTSYLNTSCVQRLVGTFTANCERLNYYYVRDTAEVRNAVSRAYYHYPDYEYSLKIQYDPTWSVYSQFLYPDSTAKAWMADSKKMVEMLRSGDSFRQPRNIDHLLCFTTDTGRQAFATWAEEQGYKVTTHDNKDAAAFTYELKATRFGNVVMDSLIDAQMEMKAEAGRHKGYYKDWSGMLPATAGQ